MGDAVRTAIFYLSYSNKMRSISNENQVELKNNLVQQNLRNSFKNIWFRIYFSPGELRPF